MSAHYNNIGDVTDEENCFECNKGTKNKWIEDGECPSCKAEILGYNDSGCSQCHTTFID